MSSRMNWQRARPYRPQESKYGAGVVLPSGAVTPTPSQDELGRRAWHEYRKWERTLHGNERKLLRKLDRRAGGLQRP
jgi:hypothetical protein